MSVNDTSNFKNALKDQHSDGNHVEQDNSDIDYILNEIGGTFGRFQIFNYVLYSIGLCYCGMAAMSYVFTTMNLDYRFDYTE